MIGLMSYPDPTRPDPTRNDSAAQPPLAPAVLLRLRVDGLDWSDHVPPAPRGHDVSVSFTSARSRARHAGALGDLGYRVVAVPETDRRGGQDEFVDVVLRGEAAEEQPSWFRALAALAERAYPLALGPAARMWAPLISRHAVTSAPGGSSRASES